MNGIDWRDLYATNQAAIARAITAPSKGLRLPPIGRLPSTPPTAASGAEQPSTVEKSRPRALVHVPRGLDALTPAPLVCMLHGCTQDPAAFAAATLMNHAADCHGFVVVYPGQDRGHNAQRCWNWFLPEHQQRDTGEPAAIAATVRELIDTNSLCTIDPGRVFVAGLSSGGAMAAILGACYPDLFAAVAVHSGLAYRSATGVGSAVRAMSRGGGDADRQGRAAHAAMGGRARPVPSIVIHGNADHTVAPANATEVLRQSMTANHLAAPGSCNHDAEHPTSSWPGHAERGHPYTHSQWTDARGAVMHELLMIDRLGHAWSGGAAGGSYTDPRGPSATDAIWAFFASTSHDAAPVGKMLATSVQLRRRAGG
jgi:poly(hydroxyalkanoate) depolymerase family esterase